MVKKTKKGNLSLSAAISMGIGAMIGAGIFALLGQTGAIVGSATWLSFLIAGGITILCGYSFARLGARYPSNGGVLEYLVQAYGVNIYSGGMGIFYYVSMIVLSAVVAKSFGAYAAVLLGHGGADWVQNLTAAGIVAALVVLNFVSVTAFARVEKIFVAVKLTVLFGFAILGFYTIQPENLAFPEHLAPSSLLSSVAVTFFAYTGFNVISGAVEHIDNPAKTLPRAIMTTILLVTGVYIVLAIVVFGNLSADQVVAAKETALAEAARPMLGNTGFVIVSVAALVSSITAINANLFSTGNNSYVMAAYGTLPKAFEKHLWGRGTEGLAITGVCIIALIMLFDLSVIASLGGMAMLLCYSAVNIGHLRVLKETKATPWIAWLAAIVSCGTVILVVIVDATGAPRHLLVTAIFLVFSFLAEWLIRLSTGRKVKPNIVHPKKDAP
ncbi:APC family permease [Chitinophaga caseinilytica]|uniref:APC family permease n=1 Tax=Chitinophaga caseinilytica TaxID=2267521 RepID=UPI003C2DAD71